ncbi:39S ribosomal protein L49, mitochondrial isoform X2 [Eptesicus fuscus]|uniref:39S ribosomal protein L49, mitochondrial isoform X2 n=1 Tax=Eptesicus fuscus TaxID=29078 RepID=UPI002403BACC|nr:39S ribosomal protein L49, mitochondrial isoform X2 [Eptesicus fuscus]
MAAAVFPALLRRWRIGVQPGCALRRLSQTQGPPNYPSFVESEDEYQFVERLLPPTRVPEPPKHEHYPTPSGWQPPRDITHGNRQMTVIRKVEGDIWALQKDVEDFLSPLLGKTPITQFNNNAPRTVLGCINKPSSLKESRPLSSLQPEQENGAQLTDALTPYLPIVNASFYLAVYTIQAIKICTIFTN